MPRRSARAAVNAEARTLGSRVDKTLACVLECGMTRFLAQAHLRTIDADAARPFYRSVLGRDDAPIFPLHEQALARGARPHWLGYLQVTDLDATLAAIVQRGGVALGPKWQSPAGFEAANILDPGGAVVSLAKVRAEGLSAAPGPEIGWRVLNTRDVAQAMRNYSDLFGFHFYEPERIGEIGLYYPFSRRGSRRRSRVRA
jgi:predicted enzyme related to lactoylglutathione lyase